MEKEPTLFQKIISGQIPAQIVHEDDVCVAIKDVNPQAPVHLLIIPKKLIPRIANADPKDQSILGHLLLTAQTLAKTFNLTKGFRIVINNGPHGGETVPHLHVHLIGGRPLDWPPG